MFVEILIGLIVTAVSYMVVPLIFLAVNRGKFEKGKATKIALCNSIIVGVIFCIATIVLYGSAAAWSAAPALLYYFINCAVLEKKSPQNKGTVCENETFEKTPCSSLENNDKIVEYNEKDVGGGEYCAQNEVSLQNTCDTRKKRTKQLLLIVGGIVIVLIAVISISIVAFKYQDSRSDTEDAYSTKDKDADDRGNTGNKDDTDDTDDTEDTTTKTWFLNQYSIAKRQYLNGLNDEINEKEEAIKELERELEGLHINYQKEIRYIKQVYGNTSAGMIQSALQNAENKHNTAVKKCVDNKNALNGEINALKKEVNNPNEDTILAIVAENCNMTSKEIYEYYYKYSDYIS